MERRALSENDIPTLPAFPVPVVREHERQPAPSFPEPPPKPRSALVIDTSAEARFVLAALVVCLGILGASVAHVG